MALPVKHPGSARPTPRGCARSGPCVYSPAARRAVLLSWLSPRVEPVLAEQAGVLDRVQKDFVEKAADAVKAAWG